jgi:hypothetical protein
LYFGLKFIEVSQTDIYSVMAGATAIMLVAVALWPADKDASKEVRVIGKRNSDIATAIALLISSEIKSAVLRPDGSITITYSNGITQNYIPTNPIEFSAELKQSSEVFGTAVLSAAIVHLDKRLKDLERGVGNKVPSDTEKFGMQLPKS